MTQDRTSLKISKSFCEDANAVIYPGLAIDFIKSIPPESIDLIVTSPPYNNGKEYEKNAPFSKYLRDQENFIDLLLKTLKNTGSVCWQVGNYIHNGEVFPLDYSFYGIFKNFDLKLRNRIIWKFGHGLHSNKRFSGRYETILWFTKSNDYTFNLDQVRIKAKYPGKKQTKGPNKGNFSGNPKGKNPSDYWGEIPESLRNEWEDGIFDIPNVKSHHIEKTIHPCQFPVELVERCVIALSNPHDRVLDPFMGVGSTILAALKHDRKALGSEKEQRYFEIAEDRIDRFSNGLLRTRQMGKAVYEPSNEKVANIPDEWIKDSSSIYFEGKNEPRDGG